MTKADELGFEENTGPLFYTGNASNIKMTVLEGDAVILRKGEVQVKIVSICKRSDGTYSGVIESVEPYQALDEEGVTEGSTFTFKHLHIYACFHGGFIIP